MRRLLALLAALPLVAAAQEPKLGETITVERIIVDARVTDSSGDPILNLTAKDFRVKIDGKPAVIESVEWIPETAAYRDMADLEAPPVEVNTGTGVPAPRGRLLVFLFQTDFARNATRTGGQMKVLPYAEKLVAGLDPEDRVAVFSYDSKLKFRLDFSGDQDDIMEASRRSLMIDDPQEPRIVPAPSLSRSFNREDARNAATPEAALTVLGNALRPIPGAKSLILFGWGLGTYSRGRVIMGRDYAIARRALESARVSVFSIDFSVADYHSLAAGMSTAAADTGGFYASTHNFPQLAIDRLQRTLSGHYELEVRKPETKVAGVHSIDVQVARRGAEVLARSSYVDKE
jgi:VWFA-related protein